MDDSDFGNQYLKERSSRGPSDQKRFEEYLERYRRSTHELLADDNFRMGVDAAIHDLTVVDEKLSEALTTEEEYLTEGRVRECSMLIDDRIIELVRMQEEGWAFRDIELHIERLREIQAPLLEIALSPDFRCNTEGIGKSLQLTQRRLKELRAMRKMYAGLARAQLSDVDLESSVSEVVAFHALGVPSQIDFEVDVRFKRVLRMDRRRSDSVLDSLILGGAAAIGAITNKRKSYRGLIRVATSEVRMDYQKYLQFSVTDNGLRIYPDDQERLVLGGGSTPDVGYGRGLQIVRRLVASYEGYVLVTSASGVGTCVSVGFNLGLIREVHR